MRTGCPETAKLASSVSGSNGAVLASLRLSTWDEPREAAHIPDGLAPLSTDEDERRYADGV